MAAIPGYARRLLLDPDLGWEPQEAELGGSPMTSLQDVTNL
jgi:hypothetical protein